MIKAVEALLAECWAGRVASLAFVAIDTKGDVHSEVIEGQGDTFALLGALALVMSQITDSLRGDPNPEAPKEPTS